MAKKRTPEPAEARVLRSKLVELDKEVERLKKAYRDGVKQEIGNAALDLIAADHLKACRQAETIRRQLTGIST